MDNGDLTYQWYRSATDSNTSGTAVRGATGAEFEPSTLQESEWWYYCVVTNTNESVDGPTVAAIASDAARVNVKKQTSGITLSRGGTHNFGNALLGYAPIGAVEIVVTNVGNQPTGEIAISFNGNMENFYVLSAETLPPIEAGGKASFTVRPLTALSAGEYGAVMTVSDLGAGDGGAQMLGDTGMKTLGLSFIVYAGTGGPGGGDSMSNSNNSTVNNYYGSSEATPNYITLSGGSNSELARLAASLAQMVETMQNNQSQQAISPETMATMTAALAALSDTLSAEGSGASGGGSATISESQTPEATAPLDNTQGMVPWWVLLVAVLLAVGCSVITAVLMKKRSYSEESYSFDK
jgi:hypothetical protein